MRAIYLAPAFLWAGFILWLCSIPGQDLPQWSLLTFDKAGHAGIFFILTLLLSWGFFRQKEGSIFHSHFLLFSVLLAVIYGGATELMQHYFFENRKADILDFIANGAGSLASLPAYSFLLKNRLFRR